MSIEKMTAEEELETIRKIMELLGPFSPRARQRILGYVKHFLKTPLGANKSVESEVE